MGHPTADPTSPVADARCPQCRAAVRPDAPWCSLCHADLRPPPPPPPPPPVPVAAAPPAYAPAPVPAAPVPADVPVDAEAQPTWPCTACGTANPLAHDVCATCGTGFLARLRDEAPLLELPGVGDVGRLSRTQRLLLALAVLGGLLGVLVLLGLLTA